MNRDERLVENERFLREANRELEAEAVERADEWPDDDVEVEFFCACGRPECRDKVVLGVHEYEQVHEEPHRFVVLAGHANPEVERVVARRAAYEVVEKLPQYWVT
jgi:hypothetical protein